MKKNLILAVISIVLLLIIPSAHALLIKTDPAVINSFDAGTSFTVNVGVQDAADLAGFQFELVYNSDTVSVISVVFGNFLETPGRTVVQIQGMPGYEIDNYAGRLSCNRMTQGSGAGADGSGMLAAITFQVKKWEDDFLNLENVHLTDTEGTELTASATGSEIRPRYHISAASTTGGSISPGGDVLVKSGESQTFTVQSEGCYNIAAVTVDGVSVGAKSQHTVTDVRGNHTIQASFVKKTFVIQASTGTGGKIYPSDSVVLCGQSGIFIITPDPDFHIADILVNGESKGKQSPFTVSDVTGNGTIQAIFEKDPLIEFCSDIPGDITGDAEVDLGDAISALRILSGIDTKVCSGADLNGDARIGIEEVVYILQQMAELR